MTRPPNRRDAAFAAMHADGHVGAVDLSGFHLSFRRFARGYAAPIEMAGANLSGADCSHTLWSDVKGEGMSFRGTNLSRATLGNSSFRNADFTGADLSGARLNRIAVNGAMMQEASLAGSEWHQGFLDGADLTGADLTGSTWRETSLMGAVLAGVDLSAVAHVHNCRFSGANFAGADLGDGSWMPAPRWFASASYGPRTRLAGALLDGVPIPAGAATIADVLAREGYDGSMSELLRTAIAVDRDAAVDHALDAPARARSIVLPASGRPMGHGSARDLP